MERLNKTEIDGRFEITLLIINNITTWQISEESKCWEIENNFWHLLECQKLVRTKIAIINKIEKWTGVKPELEKSKIIKLTNLVTLM